MKMPHYLILFRFMLAPTIVSLALVLKGESRLVIVILMYLGLLSDIFDGIIARKQNIATEKLRRLDSQVDLIFWIAIALATWIIFPSLIKANRIGLLCILVMEGLCYLISILKFGKETCTHAFLSKMWGISLLIAFTALIGFNHAGLPFKITVALGIISQADVIAIILILPKWTHDIPSAYHAYLIRKNIPFKKNKLFNG
ncbi:CDP-alcohol phosphatidyltransferase family protein [Flavobacterium sp. SM15]|uniref:CDP-alcohol phosphatidyltransferase family protein n=1 Tax=Flavobacterium sp. SM15 TaxID=2908005 RepID=UPI001EDC4D61|nr:CDP-alcohol phosphatidyltransferase family protein [Flavobacterium sp. SM15]MCG2610265.1 CDP-alcohol phosphatidyltransferase family protein [Flavobacterium sp. SM15]